MSLRYLTNPYTNYVEGKDVSIIDSNNQDISEEFKEKLSKVTKKLLNDLELKKKLWYDLHDHSLYTGIPGIAYLFFHYGTTCNDQQYVSAAQELIEDTLKHLRGKRHVAFLTGHAGPLALGAVIYHSQMLVQESNKLISKLKELSSHCTKDYTTTDLPDELLYGRIGYLYSLLFVNKYIQPSPIEDNIIKDVISEIFRSGKKFNKNERNEPPLRYLFHDKEYIGGAHGVGGIIYVLLQARKYLTEEQMKNEIEPTLQWLESIRYPSGNFPSHFGSTTDKLVQWCHGAPCMAMLFCLAYEIFNKEQYLKTAIQCGEVVWKRGLLKKGYGLCHGVDGNAYAFLSLFQLTKEPQHLYRACKFAQWILDDASHNINQPDTFSLYEGVAGTIHFLLDLQKPHEAKFPGYTL